MATAAVRRARRLRTGGAVVLAVTAVLAAASTGDDAPGSRALAGGSATPAANVVVVMTDDQDLRSLSVMEAVQRQLVARGTTFDRFFATYPLCCPSRATFLTGRYAHNHGVLSNEPPTGGYHGFTDAETALPVALEAEGYRTGLIGKYLNGYRAHHPVPPGWDVWRAALSGGSAAYGYELRRGDEVVRYGRRPGAYRTKVYGDLAVRYIEYSHELGDPFFLTLAPSIPHVEQAGVPPTPAPEYDGRFDAEPLPQPESFDEDDVSDKPTGVEAMPRLSEEEIVELTELYRARLGSFLAVDTLVRRVMEALRATGELGDTYVIFTSDNGYLLGEHRLTRKTVLYEESVRVPMVIRGPGVPAGEARDELTANVDLAPTVLDAAGAAPLQEPDGTSLLPLAANPATEWRKDLLLENNRAAALRTSRHVYTEHASGETELYDLRNDPFQLESLHAGKDQAARIKTLSARLNEVRGCAGNDCP